MTAQDSRLPDSLATRLERVSRVLDNSHLIGAAESVADRTSTFVKNSWLYEWLTAEPEPEVVVIDLHKTWTVGPFIKILDWAIETAAPWYRESTLKRGVDAVVALGERAAETRIGELLIALLEPPEPPAEDEREQKRERDGDRRTK
ncbi:MULTISPECIES: hypothetical protein [Halolamina]|uniref:Uncharacterized protein n=1 Tax=Halolamina pelagica TaxID=699431 RepID=A0A1I5UYK5_9EURY|nr:MULTISPECIES: hypothetical protein [Halolamina]NHX36819.1 hypothetical protein [Halolamina sp. R1-12]SFQ00299.1 hypothetical protein SAMN05216277_11533 [Halolamina pelagica]